MLSFGMEYERAFSIAFWSARLAAGSPPPSFAATMIARDSFEKSLPRFASAAPFLCLIEDHLLCPDTRCLPYEIQEKLVDARVVGELGMERRDEHAPLPREHRMAVDLGEHLDFGAGVVDPRRADEDPAHGLAETNIEVGLEAAHLASERVALHTEVGEPEVVAIENDHPRARSEDGRLEAAQRLVQPVQAHEPRDRRRLAAGQDQAVEPLQLLGQADLDRLGAEAPEHIRVLAEVPLHGEDADPKPPLHEAIVGSATRYDAGVLQAPAGRTRSRDRRRRPTATSPSGSARRSAGRRSSTGPRC